MDQPKNKTMKSITAPIIGMVPTRVKLGHGSFLTFDFGKDRIEEVETRRGKTTLYFGEWHLWVYMCAWRIDLNNTPLVDSNDHRDVIAEKLLCFQERPLKKFDLIDSSFNTLLEFGDSLQLFLLADQDEESEKWMLFTPNGKVFSVGPGKSWTYKDASKP